MIARAFATTVVWLTALGMIVYLLSLNWVITVLIAPMLLYAAFAVSAITWMDEVDFGRGRFYRTRQKADDKAGNATNDEEKRKRDRLDAVLRDLSDDELVRLRQRLEDGAIDDHILYEQLVGDDGELVSQRSNH